MSQVEKHRTWLGTIVTAIYDLTKEVYSVLTICLPQMQMFSCYRAKIGERQEDAGGSSQKP